MLETTLEQGAVPIPLLIIPPGPSSSRALEQGFPKAGNRFILLKSQQWGDERDPWLLGHGWEELQDAWEAFFMDLSFLSSSLCSPRLESGRGASS